MSDGFYKDYLLPDGRDAVFRSIGENERDMFNDFIRNHSYGNVFQSYEWGELKKRHGWHPSRLLLEIGSEVRGAVSFLKKGNYLCQLVYSPRGPVVDIFDPDAFQMMKAGMRDYLRDEGVGFWKLDPEVPCSDGARTVLGKEFYDASTQDGFGGIQPRAVWRLDVSRGTYPMDLLGKAARRQIKQAQKEGIEIRQGQREDIPGFYKALQETATRNQFKIRGLQYYEDMWETLHPAGCLNLVLGLKGGEVVCGALAAPFGRGVWDIYAGTTETARKTGASYLLTWQMINWAAENGYAFYDLGGIPVQEKDISKLNGLSRFKSRFGGERADFIGEYDYVLSFVQHRLWRWGMGVRGVLLNGLHS